MRYFRVFVLQNSKILIILYIGKSIPKIKLVPGLSAMYVHVPMYTYRIEENFFSKKNCDIAIRVVLRKTN